MANTITSLLAERPESELREMRDKVRAESARLRVELEQIEEALARQARRGSRSTGRRLGPTRQRILDIIGAHEDAVRPAEIIATLEEQGGGPKRGAVHNMIGRLVDEGEIERVGEGLYKLASRDAFPSEGTSEPNENGSGSPLSRVEPDHSRA